MPASPRYLPALGFDLLTPLYDPLLRWVMRESTFKRDIIVNAHLAGAQVLDIGCGTGTLAVMAKRAHPDADLVGLDPDARILVRASVKAARAGAAVTWVRGIADKLPMSDDAFDRILVCLVLHHLTRHDRQRALMETFRVLRPGGEVHIADFGPPRTLTMRIIAAFLRRLEKTADLLDGELPLMLRAAGFVSVVETGRFDSPLGPLVLLIAVKPPRESEHPSE